MEIEIPWIKSMRLRKTSLEGVHDSLKQHYSRVWDFGYELLKINPNNTVKIQGTRLNETDVNMFKRMYICYSALKKKGWKAGYRPFIGQDGCFLKTVCGGQLLSAAGRDGNNQMYPICHAIMKVESIYSWRWFTDLMKDDLDLGDGTGLTIIGDQQKVSDFLFLEMTLYYFCDQIHVLYSCLIVTLFQGLENSIKELLPKNEHRFCTKHIYSNLRKK